MINLLPPQVRDQVMYARRNTRLVRWVFILLAVLVGACMIILFGQFYIKQTAKNVQKEVAASTQQLKDQKLTETQAEVQDISNSLNLLIQVLSKQILFSKLIKQIGSAIPDGAVLSGLSIDQVEGGINLQARATDFTKGTQVQLNLQDPTNKIFEKADILSVSCDEPDPKERYPCLIEIRALFGANSQFQYITNPAQKAATPAATGAKP